VIDVRSLIPLDAQALLSSVARTHRVFTVEENPRVLGWGRRSSPSLPMRASGWAAGAHHHSSHPLPAARPSGYATAMLRRY
jgi:pyruvate/2-oxoglutarate/acetoin dehydrogenase E1 component